ncbi:MAG TPA: hydroxysqualene dehydroxylase HpnE [Stellaceae bacterium]|jgi:squalene-associated FAD-dependent desaturase
MPAGEIHVVGAGLAGLSAAATLAAAGRRVRLYEAGPQAGGRCRSYFDTELGCRIDNGNHLLLAGNSAALAYLRRIDALDTLQGPGAAEFPFIDVVTRERWTVRPNRGVVPWWIASPARRVPWTKTSDYLKALALFCSGAEATVAAAFDRHSCLFRALWEPLAVAALNTGAEQGSARLFRRVLTETLARGAVACLPLVPCEGLSESFVEPALAYLRAHGAEIRFGARLRRLKLDNGRICALSFDGGPIELGPDDSLILALPAAVAGRLVPELVVPEAASPILNAHFRAAPPPGSPLFIGIVGGTAQWVFRKREVLSVTVSAADALVDRAASELRVVLWRDVATAYGLAREPVPPARIVKERRATFLASPEELRRRPQAKTRWANLFLAGDYTDTGLPATIEGAVRSGAAAARQLLRRRAGMSQAGRAHLGAPRVTS